MGGDATHFLYGVALKHFPENFDYEKEGITYAGSLCKTEKNKLYAFYWGSRDGGFLVPDDVSLTIEETLPVNYEEETYIGEDDDDDYDEKMFVKNREHLYIGYHICSLYRDATLVIDDKFWKLHNEAQEHWKSNLGDIQSVKPQLIVIGGF